MRWLQPPNRPRAGHFLRVSKAARKQPGKPSWRVCLRSEHRSERDRSMHRCCSELCVHVGGGCRPPAWQQPLAGDLPEELLLPITCSRRSPAGNSCLGSEASVAAVRTLSSKLRRHIDHAHSDLCSEAQHGRSGRFSCAQGGAQTRGGRRHRREVSLSARV